MAIFGPEQYNRATSCARSMPNPTIVMVLGPVKDLAGAMFPNLRLEDLRLTLFKVPVRL